jgi:hypothetical protein
MWHEVALTGVMTICLISKVDAPGVSTPIRQAYLWVGPDWTLLRRARKSSINSELGLQRASAPITPVMAIVATRLRIPLLPATALPIIPKALLADSYGIPESRRC